MKPLIQFLALLYPRTWREEFGDEFDALLDDVQPRWRTFFDVLTGAITMQIDTRSNGLKIAAATAALGAIIAAGIAWKTTPIYLASAVISVTPQPDPVRPADPQAVRRRTAKLLGEMEESILSRSSLASIIMDPGLKLYREEIKVTPLEDVIYQMRRAIHVQANPTTGGPDAPLTFSITFSYPDQTKAQTVVHRLADKFAEENHYQTRERQLAYQHFWESTTVPVPPPPTGATIQLVNTTNLPSESQTADRILRIASGLGVGLLCGLLLALTIRWPRAVRKLAGYGVTALILTAIASEYFLPDRYTSTATMQIMPAHFAEDPLAPPPQATSAAEYLRQIKPQILSDQSLTEMLQSPALQLYPDKRASRSQAELLREVRDSIRIEPLPPAGVSGTAPTAFSIAFTYTDGLHGFQFDRITRFKAQEVVMALVNSIERLNSTKARSRAEHLSETGRRIESQHDGEQLEILDAANVPMTDEMPLGSITLAGFAFGVLLAAFRLSRKRSRPTIPPNFATA